VELSKQDKSAERARQDGTIDQKDGKQRLTFHLTSSFEEGKETLFQEKRIREKEDKIV
jgi:hypothetical protein